MQLQIFLCAVATILPIGTASASFRKPFSNILYRRQASGNGSSSGLILDLGYERYQGFYNNGTGLNNWFGVRFAAPPTGQRRWQPPIAPTLNREEILSATTYGPRCPQSPLSPYPTNFNFTGDEDCLSLNIWAPPNARDLPVMVYIHGGGYASDQSAAGPPSPTDLSNYVNSADKGFIAIGIQYRLGAFGFLSSAEVMRLGTVNAGLLDQTFALQWVQAYVSLLGGNASRVTVAGEEAGAGSVMLQAMAFGGHLGDSLFTNILAPSPYLPKQYAYGDYVPSQAYYAFASAAGCFGPPALPQGDRDSSIFQCLLGKDTQTLQNASAVVSGSARYGTSAFAPVTDGVFVEQLPSQQLLQKRVNGLHALVGHAQDEGPIYTPENIVTENDFINFINNSFPLFTFDDIAKVLFYYPSSNKSSGMKMGGFATSGNDTVGAATALNESTFGVGQQQRADNVFAESTFICPAYWLAEAFTGNNRASWLYQLALAVLEGGPAPKPISGNSSSQRSPEYSRAFQQSWGNLIIHNDPTINLSTSWTPFSLAQPSLLNFNETGGTPVLENFGFENATIEVEPGLRNAFDVTNAYTDEGGRGTRCDFWRSVASLVP